MLAIPIGRATARSLGKGRAGSREGKVKLSLLTMPTTPLRCGGLSPNTESLRRKRLPTVSVRKTYTYRASYLSYPSEAKHHAG